MENSTDSQNVIWINSHDSVSKLTPMDCTSTVLRLRKSRDNDLLGSTECPKRVFQDGLFGGMTVTERKPSASKKTWPYVTLSATNPTLTGLEWRMSLTSGRPGSKLPEQYHGTVV
jgi:hypothetical protein